MRKKLDVQVRDAIELPPRKSHNPCSVDFIVEMAPGQSFHLKDPERGAIERVRQFAYRKKVPITTRLVGNSDPDGPGIRIWKL